MNEQRDWTFSTKPTRATLFLRTFLPYQAWRFIRINLMMLAMMRRGHSK